MPRVNPDIMVWARETAGLTQEEAATKLGFRDSSKSSAVEKLARIERGQKEPSRPAIDKDDGTVAPSTAHLLPLQTAAEG